MRRNGQCPAIVNYGPAVVSLNCPSCPALSGTLRCGCNVPLISLNNEICISIGASRSAQASQRLDEEITGGDNNMIYARRARRWARVGRISSPMAAQQRANRQQPAETGERLFTLTVRRPSHGAAHALRMPSSACTTSVGPASIAPLRKILIACAASIDGRWSSCAVVAGRRGLGERAGRGQLRGLTQGTLLGSGSEAHLEDARMFR